MEGLNLIQAARPTGPTSLAAPFRPVPDGLRRTFGRTCTNGGEQP